MRLGTVAVYITGEASVPRDSFPSTTRRFLFWLIVTRLVLRESQAWSAATAPSLLPGQYAEARRIRVQDGPQAAQALYQELLRRSNFTDVTTATRLAASPTAHSRLEQLFAVETDSVACSDDSHDRDSPNLAGWKPLLLQCGYTARGIAERMLPASSVLRHSQAPIYVTPAAAGTHTSWPWGDNKEASVDALDALVAVCLAGLAVPHRLLRRVLPEALLQSLLDVVWVECNCDDNNALVYSLVQIVPVDLKAANDTLLLLTDWHPRTLSLTTFSPPGQSYSEGPVMYIGPDSLALVQHWLDDPNRCCLDPTPTGRCLLDVGAGSGIQALAALAVGAADRAVCLDVNPRALRFCAANAALNGLYDRIDLIWGDAVAGRAAPRCDGTPLLTSDQSTDACVAPLESILRERSQSYDLITANPPFLPVPPLLANRHGLFSDGGPSGDAVLEAAVRLAGRLLRPGGYLAVVSEFFFCSGEDSDNKFQFKTRLQHWWNDSSPRRGTGLLLTNEFPIAVETYAKRRADSMQEYEQWMEHLRGLGIGSASPGLLYLRKDSSGGPRLRLYHRRVPKTPEGGSLWTPSNLASVRFTRDAVRGVFS